MYINGEKVQIEDKVIVGDEIGYIKAIFHEDIISEDINISDWNDFGFGYLIDTNYGLRYISTLDEDIFLLERQ